MHYIHKLSSPLTDILVVCAKFLHLDHLVMGLSGLSYHEGLPHPLSVALKKEKEKRCLSLSSFSRSSLLAM